jgi:hypothetical protein
MTEMLRQGMNPMQLSIIAGASLQVIQQHYTHLTKDDAYDAMIRVLTVRRTEPARSDQIAVNQPRHGGIYRVMRRILIGLAGAAVGDHEKCRALITKSAEPLRS